MKGNPLQKIIVLGDIMLDQYIFTKSSRLSPEGPMPVFEELFVENRLGGAANVANNIVSLNSPVRLVGVIGKDTEGAVIRSLLEQKKIKNKIFIQDDISTSLKKRFFCSNSQVFRVDKEQKIKPISRKFNSLFKKLGGSLFVFSDYDKGSLGNLSSFLLAIKKAKSKSIVDPKGNDFAKYKNSYLVTPNKSEFIACCGPYNSKRDLKQKCLSVMRENFIENMLITLGSEGMVLVKENGDFLEFKSEAKAVFDVTGAGDTVIATIASFLHKGFELEDCIKKANYAAGLVVSKIGTSVITEDDLAENIYSTKKFYSAHQFSVIFKTLKKSGKKIVMTNGCFDVLHAGHVYSLREASKLGDTLVVLLNSDKSIKALKGPNRPINKLKDRVALLEAISFVDFIVSFEETTPQRFYQENTPNVLVKGGDYEASTIVGYREVIKNEGEVRIIPLYKDISSTKILKKLEPI